MTVSPVACLDDQRLIREGETAVDRYNKNIKNARADIMPMARGLVAAKRKYPATQEFGDWLHTSSYREIGDTDRAALIKIGGYDDVAETFMRNTNLVSPQTIWIAIQELLSSFYRRNSTEKGHQPIESDPTASTASIQPVSTVPNGDQKQDSLPPPRHALSTSGGGPMKDPAKAELIKLLGITVEQFSAVIGAYPYNRQRILKTKFADLAKKRTTRKAALALFERAFNVVRTGRAPILANRDIVDARIFLPDVPEAFCQHLCQDSDLSKLAQRLDRLDLLNGKAAELTAAGVELFKIHNELQHIWENGTVRPAPVAKPLELAPDDSKNQIKHPVKYCGEVIWPHDQLKHVTYKDLNMGWHIADHLLKYFEVAKPQKPNEVLVEVMQLVQDLRAASSLVGVTDTITACVQAYAKRNQRKDKADLSDGMPPGRPR